jgi:hypothetical protein
LLKPNFSAISTAGFAIAKMFKPTIKIIFLQRKLARDRQTDRAPMN